jgi:hypothetical protein
VQWSASERADDRREIIVKFGDYIENAPRCFALYPGKFTASPIVTRKFAKWLSESLAHGPNLQVESAPIEVSVARQRYLETNDYLIESDGGDLRFKALRTPVQVA